MTQHIQEIVKLLPDLVSRKQLDAVCMQLNVPLPQILLSKNAGARGMYDISQFRNIAADVITGQTEVNDEPPVIRTKEELRELIGERFDALDKIAFGVINGHFRAAIVSGNAGIGKTYNLEYILDGAKEEGRIRLDIIRGMVKATGIYKILYENREEGDVIVFDDADSVFQDDVGLNLLKAALDTTKRRWISWRAETKMELADGEKLPTEFEYKGSIIFISNIDFDLEVARQTRLTPHLKALVSRSLYINLNLDHEELVERIAMVIEDTDMMFQQGVDDLGRQVILDYFFEKCNLFREISLRTIVKLANIYKGSDNPEAFYKMANSTCLDPRKLRSRK